MLALEPYLYGLVVVGIGILGVVVLPRIVSDEPLSIPIFYLLLGAATFSLPLGVPSPDPLAHGELVEKLTELGIVLALMGAGLKLDRVPGPRRWESTWRLLGIAMPLTIGAGALLGWGVAGLAVPTAVLLGAVIAPTDPVLASEVQVKEPTEGHEEVVYTERDGGRQEVRFALTSEAGLNDSLAFPFTYIAILMVQRGVSPASWLGEWTLHYALYRIVVGLVVGAALGWALARVVFAFDVESALALSVRGLEAVGTTLLVYGATEILGGYGFLAVFVAALMLRDYERKHEYYQTLHDVAEKSEHVLMVFIMLFFGGALISGLLDPLRTADLAVALALIFLVRPLAGLLGLVGFDRDLDETFVISFFGIRGIGSFFYLSYALNEAPFPGAERLWAIVGCVALVSIVLHGITATPAVERVTGGLGPNPDEA